MPPAGGALLGGGGAGGGALLGGGVVGAAVLGGSPSGVLGSGSFADVSPHALYLPTRYRSCTALHNALLWAPAGSIGEVWGPSGFLFRAVLVQQGVGTWRLFPLGTVYLDQTSPTGAEWDGVYGWIKIDGASSPKWDGAAPGLTIGLNGSITNQGLARLLISRMDMLALTAPLTFSGSPTAILPRVWAGFWRVAGGLSAGLAASGAQGTLASVLWSRVLLSADPDAPTLLGSATGSITAPLNIALKLGLTSWGVDLTAARALFGGGWQPPSDAVGTAPAANSSMGSTGQAWAPCFGAIAGDATAPAEVTIQRFEYSGDLAAA